MQLLKKKGLKYVSIKYMQANLQKYIMWLKKSRKGIQEWMTTCITTSLKFKNLNMLIIKKVKCNLFILVFFFYCFYFKMLISDQECELYWFVNKVIMFQNALQFIKTIALCYNKQTNPKVIRCVSHPLTWHISTNYNRHFVSCCHYLHLKLIRCQQLLNDALNATISTSLKLKGKIKHLPMLDVLVDDDDYGLNIKS